MTSEKICIYNKFGYCKLMHNCKFFHTEEICQDSLCGVRNCKKRHPSTCKFYLHYGYCKFDKDCKYDHNIINTKNEILERMKSFEEMCGSLKDRCDQVNKDCNELRKELERKKSEVEDRSKEVNLLKEANKKLEDEFEELVVLANQKRKLVPNGISSPLGTSFLF